MNSNTKILNTYIEIYGYNIFISYKLSFFGYNFLLSTNKFHVSAITSFDIKYIDANNDILSLVKYLPYIYDNLINAITNSKITEVIFTYKRNNKTEYFYKLNKNSRFIIYPDDIDKINEIKRRIKIEKIKDIIDSGK